MASYNKVILMGNLTRDPETAQLPSGTHVTEFALAVNRRWNDDNGEQREEVLFIDCTAFGKVAENIQKYFAKGKSIHVEGRLKLDTWEAQDGSKRSKIRVIVEQFRFIEGARAEGQTATKGKRSGAARGNDGTRADAPRRPARSKRPTAASAPVEAGHEPYAGEDIPV